MQYVRRVHYLFNSFQVLKYFLRVKGNGKSKSLQITNGMEKQLEDFIYNFEYEISEFKKEKSEILQDMQNIREELYEKGNISQEKMDKLYEIIKQKNKEK